MYQYLTSAVAPRHTSPKASTTTLSAAEYKEAVLEARRGLRVQYDPTTVQQQYAALQRRLNRVDADLYQKECRMMKSDRNNLKVQREYEAQRRAVAASNPQLPGESGGAYEARLDNLFFNAYSKTWDYDMCVHHNAQMAQKFGRR